MKIELIESGLDDVLRHINEELVGALESKRKKDADQFICRAIGLAKAAYKLTMVKEEEPENNELAFHGNYDED